MVVALKTNHLPGDAESVGGQERPLPGVSEDRKPCHLMFKVSGMADVQDVPVGGAAGALVGGKVGATNGGTGVKGATGDAAGGDCGGAKGGCTGACASREMVKLYVPRSN